MAKKKNDMGINKRVKKTLQNLNQTFVSFMNDIRFNSTADGVGRETEINKLNTDVDKVLFGELSDMNDFTGGSDISSFLYKLLNEQNKGENVLKSVEDIFSSTDGQTVIQFFYERYKNRNLLYEDLNLVSEQLFQLNEAIMATRDAIVTADDLGAVVSRKIDFNGLFTNDGEKSNYIDSIISMEKDFNLLIKLKDHIIPKTLTFGNYYVYTVPYSKLFHNFNEKINKEKAKSLHITSTTESQLEFIDESFVADIKSSFNINTSTDTKKIVSEVNQYLKNLTIINNEVGIPITEGIDIGSLVDHLDDDELLQKKFKVSKKKAFKQSIANKTSFNDGTVDTTVKAGDYDFVSGCFIKYLDPRKVIPIKILDFVLGYYYIHEPPAQVKTTFTTNITIGPATSKLFASGPEQLEHEFLSRITDRVIKSFNKEFLEKNVQFKELILNCLRYNDLYKKQIKFEFIPKEYITEFKINEDENGEGTGVLYRSLFYAKLYLAILIFKMITIITRSTDTRIFYVKQSGFDQDIANTLQSVARSIKEKQINFMDLMSYQSIVSKVGHLKDIFMPVGRTGEKGIDFDIMAGQDVQLNNDFMDSLERAAINSTGVPSVIMNYINEADYAKTLVMANAKFLGRVVNHQSSFNLGITELYKKVAKFSTSLSPNIINSLEFTLNPPKTLNNMNLSDLINNTNQTIDYMIDSILGKNADNGEDINVLKDEVTKRLSREMLPMLPWTLIDEIMEQSKLQLIKIKKEKNLGKNSGDIDG